VHNDIPISYFKENSVRFWMRDKFRLFSSPLPTAYVSVFIGQKKCHLITTTSGIWSLQAVRMQVWFYRIVNWLQ